jgi:lysophospholipase L1-like esterase
LFQAEASSTRATENAALKRALVYITFACLVSLGLLEILIRVLGIADHLYTDPAFELAPDGGYWSYLPEFEGRVHGRTAVEIDPFGARAHAPEDSGSAFATTVAIFGDSVTFGQGVGAEKTFAARLERGLRRLGYPTKVLNYGVQGHTMRMEVAHLADRLQQREIDIVVLAFVTDDLNSEREQNYVDRFGYLTRHVFGPPSFWMDTFRAILRRSHAALLGKSAILRIRDRDSAGSTVARTRPETSNDAEDRIRRYRDALSKFSELTVDRGRLVVCLDLRENPLNQRIAAVMRSEFPRLPYFEAAPRFADKLLAELVIPRDGHPNGDAHEGYAELISPGLVELLGEPGVQESGAPRFGHG